MKLLTVGEMQALEQACDRAGHTYEAMMERAGMAVAEVIATYLESLEEEALVPILLLCGPGNNGGDGVVAARRLTEAGHRVTLYLWQRSAPDDLRSVSQADDADFRRLEIELGQARVVVDALLGTGISRPLEGALPEILSRVRDWSGPETLLVAVDVPTGLNSETGELDPAAVPADVTVTFAHPKVGQFRFPGAEAVGELVVADIGIPAELEPEAAIRVAQPEEVGSLLPARPRDGHKGSFGRLLIVAGSLNFTGAASLAAAGAVRAGAGLVTVGLIRGIHTAVAARIPEATFLILPEDLGVIAPDAARLVSERLEGYEALLLGPGLSRERPVVEFVRRLLKLDGPETRRIGFLPGQQPPKGTGLPDRPFVLDADGLNIVAESPRWWEGLPSQTVITPHPGEMGRLVGQEAKAVNADRIGFARRQAEAWGVVVLLKGAYSIVAAPDGRVTVLPFANPALATAGTGDVLAGTVAGLLAQGLGAYEAAVVGGYAHALAGQLAAEDTGPSGLAAGDLALYLPQAMEMLRTFDPEANPLLVL